MTDKLRSYGVAHRELIPETTHSTQQYENDRAEQSHEATRVRERLRHYIEDTWVEAPLYRVLEEHQASLAEDPGTPDS